MRDFMEWEPRQTLCSISFGNREQSSSESSSGSSNTGLLGGERGALSSFIEPSVRTQWSPFLQGRLETPFTLPPLNAAGVYDTQQNAVDRLLQGSVSKESSNLAQRGFLNKGASPLAAGMGVQNILPQYLQGVGQNVEQQVAIPEQVRQQQFADAMDAIRQMIGLLGSQSTQTTSGSQSLSGGRYGLLMS